jgi:P-type Ca2+ transporter type 2C
MAEVEQQPAGESDYWASHTSSEVLSRLQVDPERGLDTRAARKRRRRSGYNELRQKPPKRLVGILIDQLSSLIVPLLLAAAAAAAFFGHMTEAIAIGAVIVMNTAIGFFTELRAVRSMEALRALSIVTANVRRHGRVSPIPAKGLVPGDIVVLEAGDVVSADLRLIAASKLQSNEAILTGESMPVDKDVEPVDADTILQERSCMLHHGTAITRGSGEGVVVEVGMQTQLGRIAHLMSQAETVPTPLEKRLDGLTQQLMWIALLIATSIGLAGALTGRDLLLMFESAIALAVATVPEGLPMVATLALARGMWRMAQRNVLIDRLAAVETLGSTTVVLTDKTGTLTVNEMRVAAWIEPEGRSVQAETASADNTAWADSVQQALSVAMLCNNASLDESGGVGDPMEIALLHWAEAGGLQRDTLLPALPEVVEIAFDADTKMMATVHTQADDDNFFYAVKGAPEAVFTAVTEVANQPFDAATRTHWETRCEELATDGLRVLALAGKHSNNSSAPPYEDLTLYALVGFADPAREDVADAIASCHAAGIRIIMVTGDHKATALNIARQTGVVASNATRVIEGSMLEDHLERHLDANVFARVSPEQKLAILEALQARGEIVAMTGDGVNDAPALRRADIGVAMGKRGSQVAKEAADMVLRDDRFNTIVDAIAQGRVIYGNIRKFVIYLMSCNLSELMTIGLASLSGAPLPLLPLQVLYLNLVTDVFPAFALGAGEGEASIMQRSPRDPKEPVLTTSHWREIAIGAAAITVATLVAFGIGLQGLDLPPAEAVTMSFLTLALAQLWHVFNMRTQGSGLLLNEVTRNPFVWVAIAISLVLILVPIYLKPAATVLGLSAPSSAALLISASLSSAPFVLGQILKSLPSRGESKST